MAKGYNGHSSYNAWNVSLWIHNDEGLYREAKRCIRSSSLRDEAAQALLDSLYEMGVTQTPDGVTYTKSTIRAAMVGM